jgi:hypothetical protein
VQCQRAVCVVQWLPGSQLLQQGVTWQQAPRVTLLQQRSSKHNTGIGLAQQQNPHHMRAACDTYACTVATGSAMLASTMHLQPFL